MLYDDSDSKTVEIIDKLWTKVKIDGVTKNIDEATEVDYAVEIENHPNLLHTLVKQTITNKGTKEQKIDLCTAFKFSDIDSKVDTITVPMILQSFSKTTHGFQISMPKISVQMMNQSFSQTMRNSYMQQMKCLQFIGFHFHGLTDTFNLASQ